MTYVMCVIESLNLRDLPSLVIDLQATSVFSFSRFFPSFRHSIDLFPIVLYYTYYIYYKLYFYAVRFLFIFDMFSLRKWL